MKKLINTVGEYFILLGKVLRKPDNWKAFRRQLFYELKVLGIDSLPIACIISAFVGAAVVIQFAASLSNPIYPTWITGYTTRKAIMLEFAPTMIGLVLAGKVGSRIASELGTMRITEQIDALNIMGVNSANYLIFPKIVAFVLSSPVIVILSVFSALAGGWLFGMISGAMSSYEFLDGVQLEFDSYDMFYGMAKGLVYNFIIASVSSYRGYTVTGGALEVGQASTRAVVESCIVLIAANLALTSILI
ncbi:MAG: ABC transporter permease [Bacteroidales bacterium]|nr:ABC transporter permease [Bacteroidales bacterium]